MALAAASEAKKQERFNEVARIAMAKVVENSLLDKGFNVDVTTAGPLHTTIKLKYIFVSKVFAHQLDQQSELLGNLRKAGFKKLVASDGYNEQWTWNL